MKEPWLARHYVAIAMLALLCVPGVTLFVYIVRRDASLALAISSGSAAVLFTLMLLGIHQSRKWNAEWHEAVSELKELVVYYSPPAFRPATELRLEDGAKIRCGFTPDYVHAANVRRVSYEWSSAEGNRQYRNVQLH